MALDECHKMCINKNCKIAVIWPSKDRMELLSNYLPFRSACLKVPLNCVGVRWGIGHLNHIKVISEVHAV